MPKNIPSVTGTCTQAASITARLLDVLVQLASLECYTLHRELVPSSIVYADPIGLLLELRARSGALGAVRVGQSRGVA